MTTPYPAADMDSATDTLRAIFGDALDGVLDVAAGAEHAGLLIYIESLTSPAQLVEAIPMMISETTAGRLLDPITVGADVPWCRLLVRGAGEDLMAMSLATRRWAARLSSLQVEDVPVSPVVQGVSAWTASIFEARLGRTWSAARWATTASAVTDYEGVPGLAAAVYVRAMRLLRP